MVVGSYASILPNVIACHLVNLQCTHPIWLGRYLGLKGFSITENEEKQSKSKQKKLRGFQYYSHEITTNKSKKKKEKKAKIVLEQKSWNQNILQYTASRPTISSVASFWYWGGGARPPNVPTEKKSCTCNLYARASEASKRLRNIYISGLKIHLHTYAINQCSSLLLLMVWRYKWQYTDKTLTLRKIYEYASELRKFSHFYILKQQFFSICCWYFRYTLSQKHIFRFQITSAYIYNQCSFLLLLMTLRYIYYTDKTLTLRKYMYMYASEQA